MIGEIIPGVFPSKAQEHVIKTSTHEIRRIRRHLIACGSHYQIVLVSKLLGSPRLIFVIYKWDGRAFEA